MATLNPSGAAFARARIAAGDYDATAAWSFTAADGDAMLGANGDNWANYDRWHLGHDLDQAAATKARFSYPFGKGGKVYRSALTAIRQRSEAQGATDIFDDAGKLLALIDAKEGKGARVTNRAYAVLDIKAINEDQRIIEGVATTPSTDRMDDIVEPRGAVFSLPLPLLWQHDSDCPVGNVIDARVSDAGIAVTCQFQQVDGPPSLQEELDRAWAMVKAGLVRGLSIGFSPIESAQIEGSWGRRYLKWEWLELSTVTIPANQEATIQTVKSIDARLRAAPGHSQPVVTSRPGVAGKSQPVKLMEPKMRTIAEQIVAFEATRQAKAARMTDIMNAAGEKGETLDAAQTEEYDGIEAEVASIDAHLKRLRALEKTAAATAKPVERVDSPETAAQVRSGLVVKTPEKLEPGIRFARYAKVKALARLNHESPLDVAVRMYGADSEVAMVVKAPVEAGSNISGNWAAALTGTESTMFADFAAFLRPATILGKFGTLANGVQYPSLRRVPFRERLISQTGGGEGYWVGEAKPKPLTKFDFAGTTLTPLKVANIAILTMENVRSSNPSSEMIVRDSLRDALVATQDVGFIDPTNGGTSDVKPAAISNGAPAIASTGTDADAVRLDIRALFQKFIDADNPPEQGVFVMSTTNALALTIMLNALGQREFPGMTMMGGMLEGIPVIASRRAGTYVTLMNASDIYEADDGDVAIDMSMEASVEMLDGSLIQDADAGTGTSLVSLWQNNLVGLRAERTINWKRRRESAVAYITGAVWGGAVPAS